MSLTIVSKYLTGEANSYFNINDLRFGVRTFCAWWVKSDSFTRLRRPLYIVCATLRQNNATKRLFNIVLLKTSAKMLRQRLFRITIRIPLVCRKLRQRLLYSTMYKTSATVLRQRLFRVATRITLVCRNLPQTFPLHRAGNFSAVQLVPHGGRVRLEQLVPNAYEQR